MAGTLTGPTPPSPLTPTGAAAPTLPGPPPPPPATTAPTLPAPSEGGGCPVPELIAGRYQVEGELGHGGMGRVLAARDLLLGRRVAVKQISAAFPGEEQLERFQREARAASALDHPNVLVVHDVVVDQGRPCIITELLEGTSLRELLRQGPLPVERVLALAVQLAEALVAAHGKGILHRDLKPENLFVVTGERLKVLDFGIAKLLEADAPQSTTGAVVGTPGYMAPEQARGRATGFRADLFSCGAVLHELLGGVRPFAGKTPLEVGLAVIHDPPAPLPETVPEWLQAVVRRCLEKDPAARFPDAQALLDALRLRGGEVPAGATPVRRHRRWKLAAVLAACAAAAGVLFVNRPRPQTAAGGRLRVAVADVANETGEKDLDVLSGLLVTSLEQSRKLSVLTQSRVLDLAAQAGLKAGARVDEALAREVGRQNGISLLLLPAVRQLAGTYFVELRAVDPVRDEHLFTVGDRAASREGLVDALDRLSEKTRLELKEDRAEAEKNRVLLGAAMTRSMEAYQHYAAGVEAYYRDTLVPVALREQLKAVELDPQFAVAHAALGDIYGFAYSRWDLARPQYEAGLRDKDRMPEKERLLLGLFEAGWVERILGGGPRKNDLALAERLAGELVERYPQDKFILFSAGNTLLRVLKKADRAEALFRQVLELDPAFGGAVDDLWPILRRSGRKAEAVEIARRAVATRRSAANLSELAWLLWGAGSTAEAAAVARDSVRANAGEREGFLPLMQTCAILSSTGAGAECVPVLQRIAVNGLNEHERDSARTWLLNALLALGRVREALHLRETGRILETSNYLSVGRWRHDAPEALAFERAKQGEKADRRNGLAWFGALKAAAELDATMGAKDREDAGGELVYQALVAAHERRYGDALQKVRSVIATVGKNNWYWLHYLLAETLLAAGKAAEAAEVRPPRATMTNTPDTLDGPTYYPPLLLVRARALEQLGRPADAVKDLDELLAFWKEPDQDLPQLVEAKAMRARLVAGARP